MSVHTVFYVDAEVASQVENRLRAEIKRGGGLMVLYDIAVSEKTFFQLNQKGGGGGDSAAEYFLVAEVVDRPLVPHSDVIFYTKMGSPTGRAKSTHHWRMCHRTVKETIQTCMQLCIHTRTGSKWPQMQDTRLWGKGPT